MSDPSPTHRYSSMSDPSFRTCCSLAESDVDRPPRRSSSFEPGQYRSPTPPHHLWAPNRNSPQTPSRCAQPQKPPTSTQSQKPPTSTQPPQKPSTSTQPPQKPSKYTQPPQKPSKCTLPTVGPPTGSNLTRVTTAPAQADAVADALKGINLPWLRANEGSGTKGDAKKMCPDAPRPLRTRPSLAALPLSNSNLPSSPLPHNFSSDDILQSSSKFRCPTPPYPFPLTDSGKESPLVPNSSGSSEGSEARVPRLTEGMFNSYDNFGVKNDFHARSQWRLNPGFNDGKHQHESDFDIADLGSGMTKMVNGIKDLTIKGTMCLSPRQKDTFQAEPWLPGPYESENDGGANHPNAALRNDTEHSSVTIPTSRSFHDGPANRTRSKTRMGSGNTADGSANSASLSNPPPVRRRKVLTGPNNRKRRSATVDNYGSNGGPSLRRRFPSSGERSCKEAVKAVTTRRSQRLKRA